MKLRFLLPLVLSTLAFGQAARLDNFAWSTANVGNPATTVLTPVGGAQITVCSYPATGQTASTPCTNKANTCTDATLVTCNTSNNPLTADAQGNFGAWLTPGVYDVSICSGGACSGPYHYFLPVGFTVGSGPVITNATITNPTITTPTISNSTVSNPTITGTDSGTETLNNKTLVSAILNGGVANNGTGFQHKRFGATCTTAAAQGSFCSTTYNWPTAFADTNYTVACTGSGNATGFPVVYSTIKTASSLQVIIVNVTAIAASFSEVDCIAAHD